jgi:hypothetical protein
MKIIGKAENNLYLITATQEEIFSILGEKYLTYTDKKDLDEAQKEAKERTESQYKSLVGFEIPVSKLYEAARLLARKWDENKSIMETTKTLRQFASDLESMASVYNIQR